MMASSSDKLVNDIVAAVANGSIKKLRKLRKDFGDDLKFSRICDSVIGRVEDCDFDMCKFVVEELKADVNVKDRMGNFPLLRAVEKGYLRMTEYLIKSGADITVRDPKGQNALHMAIPQGTTELFIMLLKEGVDKEVDSVVGRPLQYAANYGRMDIIKILLENGVEVNPDSKVPYTPLVFAMLSDNNKLNCLEILLKAGADPNKFVLGSSPLAHAIEGNVNCCIGPLLVAGADVDLASSCGLKPMEHAFVVGNHEAAYILIMARPRLMATPGWSFRKMVKSVNSGEAITKRDLHTLNLIQKGDDACNSKDYSSAITYYSEALDQKQTKEMLANRSMCWAQLGEVSFALEDAQECVELEPGWPKAHLREAIAWRLLKMYEMSSHSFERAFKYENERTDRSG